ncbi:hypothetical protein HDU82_007002 [Entophlyctis luteolus]|nr:hypothetical protein HDU82_007002 [Entophlyctis luteolus]
MLGNFANFDPRNKASFIAACEMDEIEVRKGIMQILRGLEFLHNNGWIHGCLAPDAIYINAKGDWKIAGFSFSQQSHGGSSLEELVFYLSNYPPFCSPSMDFLAPEAVLDSKYSSASDIWSLGCLIHAIFNNGQSPIYSNDNVQTYRTRLSKLGQTDICKNIPPSLANTLMGTFARDPKSRISLQTIAASEFFDNVLLSTVSFLEAFVEKSRMEKAQFLKGLVAVLPQFSLKLVNRKILPTLLNELKDPLLTPFVLPNIFWISEKCSDEEFNGRILPALKPVFRMTDPPQALILLLSRMDIFVKRCSSSEIFKQDVMPMLYGALETNVPQIQEQAIKGIPMLLPSLDFTTTKSEVFPRVMILYTSQTSSLGIRIAALIAVHGMLKVLDKYSIVEKILPTLRMDKGRVGYEPAVLVAILAVYDEIAKHVEREVIAREILPEIWRMSVDRGLNVKQVFSKKMFCFTVADALLKFKKFMGVIRSLTDRIEEQHTKYLQDAKTLDSIGTSNLKTQSDGLNQSMDFAALVSASPTRRLSLSSTRPTTTETKVSNEDSWADFNVPTVASRNFSSVSVTSSGVSTVSNTVVKKTSKPEITSQNMNNIGGSAMGSLIGAPDSKLVPTLAPPPTMTTRTFHNPQTQPTQSNTFKGFVDFPSAGTLNGGTGYGGANFVGSIPSSSLVGTTSALGNSNGSILTPTGNFGKSNLLMNPQGASKRNKKLNEFDPFG